MILVFGGAYNGKIKWVKEKYKIEEVDIFYCNSLEIDLSKRVICGLHKFTYAAGKDSLDPLKILIDNKEILKDKIIICDEISSGIVPLKKEERVWRENTGRCLQFLSENSNKVYRIFCGLEMVLKDV
ncbi:MAG: bifunctional adenosylcobinamide kinase/adenosylcobinamide-phosphate guanylyltransferase [Clostridium septicum]|uniref:bifunctional adenosylcobinamide kinase/adenosylcobinamide-phosphate guanylyltransferase n=1 Tax=Clostridium septicum TaxID=1504 RepID=UPI002586113D|nr:bifunctional adenosylcobinamide kinase/adenosylcobinamide-phosphate guanylyltransferase [Clostridium septicum]MDU1313681.1 bifunctional adenosylcobinamide kinase/adenosylcobinamide-phosphate guanylyltransferase [Clostridium septicum]